jgi:hypothetical protein
MPFYRSDDQIWGVQKEATFRTNAGGTFVKCDEPVSTFEPPEPTLTKEGDRRVGSGRNRAFIRNLGYDLGSKGIDFYFQTGFFANHVMGACTTTQFHIKSDWVSFDGSTTAINAYVYWNAGTHTETVTLWGINSNWVFESATATSNSATAVVINSTASDNKWRYIFYFTTSGTAVADTCIISNTGKSVIYLSSVNNADAAEDGNSGAGDTATGYTYYYRHAITESDTLPSFTFHRESQHASGAGYDIIREYLGSMIAQWDLTIETKAKIRQTPTITTAELDKDKSELVTPPDAVTLSEIGWDDLKGIWLTYGGTEIQTTIRDHVKALNTSVVNNYLIEPAMGDKFPKTQHPGIRDYTIGMTYYPSQLTLYELSQTEYEDYTGAVALVLNFSPSQYRMFQIKHTDLMVDSHTQPMVRPSDGEVLDQICEAEISAGDGNTGTIDVIDTLPSTNLYTG